MSNNPFGGPSSSLTNNPFAFQTDLNHASNRYPKIDDSTLPGGQLGAGSSTIGGGQWGHSSLAGGYNPQQQYPQQTGFPQNGQFFSSSLQQSYTSSPQASFQSSSTFGQQQLQPQLPGNQGSAQFQTSNPVYQGVAALDPYANLALLPQALPNPAHKPPSSPTTESFGGTSFHSDHPRSFVRDHKSDLEKWDPQTWKQFIQSIDKLKDAWIARKDVVNRAIAGYNHQWTQQDVTRAQDLLREADSNTDLASAAKFQLEEVYSGYRHSSDTLSRSRVREALNAGLNSLPEWPEELQTSTGVTVAYANPLPQQAPILSQPTQYFVGGGNQLSGFYQQQQPSQQPFSGYGGGPGQSQLQQGFYQW